MVITVYNIGKYLLSFLSMFMPPAYFYAFKNTSEKIPDRDILNPRIHKILTTSKFHFFIYPV